MPLGVKAAAAYKAAVMARRPAALRAGTGTDLLVDTAADAVRGVPGAMAPHLQPVAPAAAVKRLFDSYQPPSDK